MNKKLIIFSLVMILLFSMQIGAVYATADKTVETCEEHEDVITEKDEGCQEQTWHCNECAKDFTVYTVHDWPDDFTSVSEDIDGVTHYYHEKRCKIGTCNKQLESGDCSTTSGYTSVTYKEEEGKHVHGANCTVCGGIFGNEVAVTYVRGTTCEKSGGKYYDNTDGEHKVYCTDLACNNYNTNKPIATEKHKWKGGKTYTSPHKCARCLVLHEKAKPNDPTGGMHYFDIPDKTNAKVGPIGSCIVCKEVTLELSLDEDTMKWLDALPEKDDYTILGANPQMAEQTIPNDAKIRYETNFWPIDAGGKVMELGSLTLQKYIHGTFYQHAQKLIDDSAKMASKKMDLDMVYDRYKNGDDSYKAYIYEYLTGCAGYNKDYVSNEILSGVNTKNMLETLKTIYTNNSTLATMGTNMFWKGKNIMQLTWGEITKIGSPMGNAWLPDGTSSKIEYKKYLLSGEAYREDVKAHRQPLAYEADISGDLGGHYEFQDDGVSTRGFATDVQNKREDYNTDTFSEMRKTLLFTIGSCEESAGGGVEVSYPPDPPTVEEEYGNIYARLVVGYRATSGEQITKGGVYIPPADAERYTTIWNSETGKTEDISTDSPIPVVVYWTQGAGYRFVGAYYEGTYVEKDSPDWESRVDTDGNNGLGVPKYTWAEAQSRAASGHGEIIDSTSVNKTNPTITFSLEPIKKNLFVGIVLYFEPIKITLQHFDNLNSTTPIVTDKNVEAFCSEDKLALSDIHFSTKNLASLNKQWWPGYILKDYTIYDDNTKTKLASKSYNFDTTTKYNPENPLEVGEDAKRYALVTTALLTNDDPYYTGNTYPEPHKDVYNNEFNYDTLFASEILGFGPDKIVRFDYSYPEADIQHVKYENIEAFIQDKTPKDIKYTIRLDGDNMLIKSLDTTALNATEIDAGRRFEIVDKDGAVNTFYYDVSDRALVQIWIYEKVFDDSGNYTGEKKLYEVIAPEKYMPTVSDDVKKDVISGDLNINQFYNGYILSTAGLGIFTNKVWSNLEIKFAYKEIHSVYVKYVDEDGNAVINPKRIIIDGDSTTIPIPDLKASQQRVFKEYKLDSNSPVEDPTGTIKAEEKVILKLKDGSNHNMLVVYKRTGSTVTTDPEDPTEVPPYAVIKSNKRENKEYNVEDAIPTEEDLYANIVTDEYILRDYFRELEDTQKFNVKLVKKYYERNDEDSTNTIKECEFDSFEYDFNYKYYGGELAQLYILESGEMFNTAIKDGKVLLDANWGSDKPTIEYVQGGGLSITTGADDSETQSKVISATESEGIIDIKVLILGIAYSLEDIPKETEITKYKNGVLDQLLINLSTVTGDKLNVKTSTGVMNAYLIPKQVPLRHMYSDDIVNVLIDNGYYNPKQMPGMCNKDCLYKNEGIYIDKKAQNDYYITEKMNIAYILDSWAKERNPEADEQIVKKYLDASTKAPYSSNKLFYDDDDEERVIKKNNIFVYTPIINRIELSGDPNDSATLNQIIDKTKVMDSINREAEGYVSRILNIDEEFLLTIPHNGYHPGRATISTHSDGYGDKEYNYNGVDKEDTGASWIEEDAFAKTRVVKFSFDVYLKKTDKNTDIKNIFIPANTWYELPNKSEEFTFTIPLWVKDNEKGTVDVRIVATNYLGDDSAIISDDPLNANMGPGTVGSNGKYNAVNQYILQQKYSVFLAGRVYDLEVRDSNDIGWTERLTKALTLSRVGATNNMFLPIGQKGQIRSYNLGIKLGYSVYFDLKTKGTASKDIKIAPKIYYVSNDGNTVREDITLYYEPIKDSSKYVKLDSNKLISMKMVDTQGSVNNKDFTKELARAIKLMEYKGTTSTDYYAKLKVIGSIFGDLALAGDYSRLPYENLKESSDKYGYSDLNAFISAVNIYIHNDGMESDLAKTVQSIRSLADVGETELQNIMRNFNGHWYGQFELPQTTKVISGTNKKYSTTNLLKDGYLVVVFDEIITTTDGTIITGDYLSYDKPDDETTWEKEAGGVYKTITLPNGNTANIPAMVTTDESKMISSPMAIYEVGKTRADDEDTSGTH